MPGKYVCLLLYNLSRICTLISHFAHFSTWGEALLIIWCKSSCRYASFFSFYNTTTNPVTIQKQNFKFKLFTLPVSECDYIHKYVAGDKLYLLLHHETRSTYLCLKRKCFYDQGLSFTNSEGCLFFKSTFALINSCPTDWSAKAYTTMIIICDSHYIKEVADPTLIIN